MPHEARVIGPMIEASPNALARRLNCSNAQARALQHYLVLVFVAAYRRCNAGDAIGASARANVVLQRIPPRIRAVVQDALGESDVFAKKSGAPLRAAAGP